ncbi:tripartite tricarboxylate transporter substrate binding protein [Comamonas sp. BIGb0124]|uniref:Bug family tripartite tricarboxylate transporter substrate binding protein n=1 Tax=Comamonas sp. BIGb0124 TaxID=2485130 RepID=UPI001F486097|nr:tripartite tricarboxylate transporter substrate binding protein [Comamonas sp. BIGb0124]
MALAAAPALHANGKWPEAPVHLVVTFPPGGASDIVARVIAPHLSSRLGQPVVIDNRPGAGSTIGARLVADAKPDGLTLLMSNSAPLSISPALLNAPGYSPDESFSHIAYIGAVPTVFVTHPSVPARNLAELVQWIRQQGAPVAFGSGGAASVGHIVGEQFAKLAGVELLHVPYKGAGPMRSDLLGGQILLAVDALPQNIPLAQSDKLRLLAVTSRQRAPQAASVPTVAESGYPSLVAENYVGVSAPKGTPEARIALLHQAIAEAVALPEVRKALIDQGFELRTMSASEFSSFVHEQARTWAPLVRQTGATL